MSIEYNENEPDVDVESVLLQDESQKRRENLINELVSMSGDDYQDYAVGPSAIIDPSLLNFGKKKKKKKKESEPVVSETKESVAGEKDWFSEFVDGLGDAVVGASMKPRRRSSYQSDVDEMLFGSKKKKKKKKKKGQPTDFRKEFEPENLLFTNILRDTTRFIDTLQREYDTITSKKGSGRGTTKNTQDLVANINSARQLAMSLVDKKVNLKKLATELSFKERKELGLANGEGTDLGEYGSAYLKKLIDERQMIFNGGREDIIDLGENYDDDGVAASVGELLSENIDRPISEEEAKMYGDDDRTEEADLYLKYENENVTVRVSIDKTDSENYSFYAVNDKGEQVYDYPLPVSRITSINRSTGIATDEFGQKYFISWV